MFLFMLFLNFILEDREVKWLSWLERPLAAIGKLDQLAVVIAGGTLVLVAEFLADDAHRSTIMVAGVLGMITYIAVDGLGSLFHTEQFEHDDETAAAGNGGPRSWSRQPAKPDSSSSCISRSSMHRSPSMV